MAGEATLHLHAHRAEDDDDPGLAELVGPYAWGIIHHAVESFPCPPCAADGKGLMRFAHDVVNIKLGKGLRFPANFDRHVELVNRLAGAESLAANAQGCGQETCAQGVSQETRRPMGDPALIDRALAEVREELNKVRGEGPAGPCSAVIPQKRECLDWAGTCAAQVVSCGGTEYVAVRRPVIWTVHEVRDGGAPSYENQLGRVRKAGDAAKYLKDRARELQEAAA